MKPHNTTSSARQAQPVVSNGLAVLVGGWLALLSGCGPSEPQAAASDSTQVTAPVLTLADSLADRKIPYRDQYGNWVLRHGDGFSLRFPDGFKEAQNLEGDYVWVLALPPLAGNHWIKLYKESTADPASSLQALGDAFVAEYDENAAKVVQHTTIGKGKNAYQSIDLQWRMQSDRGVVLLDSEMETLSAIWLSDGHQFTLSHIAEGAVSPDHRAIFEKVALSMQME